MTYINSKKSVVLKSNGQKDMERIGEELHHTTDNGKLRDTGYEYKLLLWESC